MMRKGAILFFLFVFLALVGGCETVKGAFHGAQKDYQSAKKVDDWVKEHLW